MSGCPSVHQFQRWPSEPVLSKHFAAIASEDIGSIMNFGVNIPVKHVKQGQLQKRDDNSESRDLSHRPYLNCLCCGKIYDCRSKPSPELCTFCGANIVRREALSSSSSSAQLLKDRLLQYDKESAQRSTILDDQSDFFEFENIDLDKSMPVYTICFNYFGRKCRDAPSQQHRLQ